MRSERGKSSLLLALAAAAVVSAVLLVLQETKSHSVELWNAASDDDVDHNVAVFDPWHSLGTRTAEATSKVNKERVLVDMAKMKLSKKHKAVKSVALGPKKSKLRVIGIQHSASSHITRLSRHDREQFTSGELQDREREVSEQLHEKNKELARRLREKTRRKMLAKIRHETSKDIHRIRHNKQDRLWASNDNTDQLADQDVNDESYSQLEHHIQHQLNSGTYMKRRGAAILKAIKRDSKDVTAEAKDAAAVAKHTH